jgi:hypothetical protein
LVNVREADPRLEGSVESSSTDGFELVTVTVTGDGSVPPRLDPRINS